MDSTLKNGIFYTIKDDGSITDEGIVDEFLSNEDIIDEKLISAGVIKDMRITKRDLED